MLHSSAVASPYSSRRFTAVATIAVMIGALALATGGVTSALADDALGSVSGTLTGGGAALSGAEVDIQSEDGEFLDSTETDDDGAWSFSDIPASDYTLEFTAPDGANFVRQWWDDKATEEDATYFTVAAGQVLDGMNAELAIGATISGKVTGDDAPGVGVANVDVMVQTADGSGERDATTDSDGDYSIDGLPAGDYSVQFQPESGPYLGEWWNNHISEQDADLVTVSAGGTASAVDASLALGATVSGTVDVAGSPTAPLADVRVSVVSTNHINSYDAQTDADGHYTVSGVATGRYVVSFRGPTGKKLAVQYWKNKTTFGKATRLSLAAGQHVTAVDAVLQPGASISGTVYMPGSKKVGQPHELVSVFIADGREQLDNGAQTNSTGHFTITGLPAGEYKLGFSGTASVKAAFEFWDGAFTLSHAKTITLKTGQKRSGIVQTLITGTKITGTIKGDRGHPKAVGDVTVLLWASDQHPGTSVLPPLEAITNSKGQYSFGHIGPGTYTLEFEPGGSDYLGQWWKMAGTQAKATKLVVKSTARTGINATLALAVITAGTPTITGTAAVDSTLTAHPGSWKPGRIVFTYQWQRDGAPIAKATKATYVPTSSDVGHSLSVAVTGTIPAYESEGKSLTVVSAETALVVAAG